MWWIIVKFFLSFFRILSEWGEWDNVVVNESINRDWPDAEGENLSDGNLFSPVLLIGIFYT